MNTKIKVQQININIADFQDNPTVEETFGTKDEYYNQYIIQVINKMMKILEVRWRKCCC